MLQLELQALKLLQLRSEGALTGLQFVLQCFDFVVFIFDRIFQITDFFLELCSLRLINLLGLEVHFFPLLGLIFHDMQFNLLLSEGLCHGLELLLPLLNCGLLGFNFCFHFVNALLLLLQLSIQLIDLFDLRLDDVVGSHFEVFQLLYFNLQILLGFLEFVIELREVCV